MGSSAFENRNAGHLILQSSPVSWRVFVFESVQSAGGSYQDKQKVLNFKTYDNLNDFTRQGFFALARGRALACN